MIRLICLVLCIALAGCNPTPAKYRDFFSKQSNERFGLYYKYSLADQYEIMQIGNTDIEPPMTELADSFAKNGKQIIPLIKSKIKTEKPGIRVRNVANVLLIAQRDGGYECAKDKELMVDLRNAAAKDTTVWRETTQKIIHEIELDAPGQ